MNTVTPTNAQDAGWQVFESKKTRRRRVLAEEEAKHVHNEGTHRAVYRALLPIPDPTDAPTTRTNRHEFYPPLEFQRIHPRNASVSAAISALACYNDASFATFTNPLYISALKDVNIGNANQSRMFLLGREGLFARVCVGLQPSTSAMLETLRVC